MKKINSIPRCSAAKINWDQFRKDNFLGSKPLIIEGALEDWSALKKWSSSYFTELYAGRTLSVGHNNRAIYSRLATNQSQSVQRDAIELECSEAMKRIDSGSSKGTYYLQKQSIPNVFPELMKDITPPPFVSKDELTDINLWFGGAGNITPLHFDFSNNFLAQVTGVKDFVLISPSYYSECYPADGTNLNHLSRVDLEAPDF
ncbi:cupin-like domain-containing protein, partial [Verrucomicrobia bacterium]|nr:cupin-like domain-containing protein [Verrucomicrobiota bacterium]